MSLVFPFPSFSIGYKRHNPDSCGLFSPFWRSYTNPTVAEPKSPFIPAFMRVVAVVAFPILRQTGRAAWERGGNG